MNNFTVARQNMVDNQIRANKVTDPAVIEAFLSIPQEDIVSNGKETVAYADENTDGLVENIPDNLLGHLVDRVRLVAVIKERTNKRGKAKIYNKLRDTKSSSFLFDVGTPAILSFAKARRFHF